MRRRTMYGFTLIELMVVILILAILAALVVPRVLGRAEQAKDAKAKTDISTIGAAIKQFRLDNDRYPTQDEGLDALQSAPQDLQSKWHGPYIEKSATLDPWGNPYQYKYPGSGGNDYDLSSQGPPPNGPPIHEGD